MKKIGVFGAGHLGKIHCKCIKESSNAQLSGIYDPDMQRCEEAAKEFGTTAFHSPGELLAMSEIIDVVTATSAHYEMAKMAILNKKDVFIEKPVTATLEEAEELMRLAGENNVKVQIGHVERFNPAFLATQPYIHEPKFIETHRLALFNPRGNDVSVVLDLMIHDLDIVLNVVKSEITDIHASGVGIITDTFDIANVRLSFADGCVANLTASRISLKNMRKSRFFQPDAYIGIDFLEKKSEIIRLSAVEETDENPFAMILDLGDKGKKQIMIESPEIQVNNAILAEIESFVTAIETDSTPTVTLQDGYRALKTAYRILEKMNENVK